MKIEGKEAVVIAQALESALQDGARYVCLDVGKDNQGFRKETMRFFSEKTDAQQYSYVNRNRANEYLETLPVLPLQQQLDRSIELQQLTKLSGQALKDMTIDTSRILFEEHVRRDIFTSEIATQLRDRGIKPDLKQLIENIRDDKQHFEIAGTRRENGVDKPYVIIVEQNESRAFLLGAIAPQQSQQKINGYMESKVLEGTVRREDALEIKNRLEQEKEKGNRFVSFPGDKDDLRKDDFTAFKSSISALEHAYENTTDRSRYAIRSIPVVEKEINHLLEHKKEQQRDKPMANERREKGSRDQEMSR